MVDDCITCDVCNKTLYKSPRGMALKYLLRSHKKKNVCAKNLRIDLNNKLKKITDITLLKHIHTLLQN